MTDRETSGSRGEIVIGAVAYAPKVVRVWNLMRKYLRGKGCSMGYLLFSHYDALVARCSNTGSTWPGTPNLAYARIQQAVGGSARAICMRDSDLDFRTYLVARRDRGITSLGDLRGKTLALGSADSMQAAILHAITCERPDLERDLHLVRFVSDIGRHGDIGASEREVLAALRSEPADAEALSAYTWAGMVADWLAPAEDLAVVGISPGYSHCVLNVLAGFDAKRSSSGC